jgi:hypothetical protein
MQTHSGYAMIIRRTLLEITDNSIRPIFAPTGQPLGHDQWAWLLAAIFGKIVVLPDVLCLYRQHNNNLFGGSARSMNKTLSLAMQPRSYRDLSNNELYFADFLKQMPLPHSAPLRARLDAAVSSLTRRAHLNAFRSELYTEKSNVVQRVQAFGKILLHGGICPEEDLLVSECVLQSRISFLACRVSTSDSGHSPDFLHCFPVNTAFALH